MTLAITITLPGVPAARAELTRTLTTIGSAPAADVRLAGVPAQWIVAHREGEKVTLAVLATGRRVTLDDRAVVIDGASIARAREEVERALAIGPLALTLAQAEDPTAALGLLLDQAVAACGADLGAVVLREGGSHQVAIARDAAGRVLSDGASILSDTVLHEVLGGGLAIAIEDVAADPRLAHVPSVVNLALRSVVAIPMVLGDQVAGALYLGARRPLRGVGARLAADLAVAASMALPLVSQLRRNLAPAVSSSPVMAAAARVRTSSGRSFRSGTRIWKTFSRK